MMAELDVFISKSELADFLCDALASRYKIQLNKNLVAPTPEFCATDAEVRLALDSGQYAFLLERPDYTRHPVNLRPIERDGIKYWYPRAMEGGPVIEVHSFASYAKDGHRVVPCSLLSYQSKIIDPETMKVGPAGPDVRAAFAELVADLRKVSRRVGSANKSALVTPGVDEMLAAGWRLASPFCGRPVGRP